jgi:signal transduction histidine kinase
VDRRRKELRDFNSFRVDIRDSGPGIPPMFLERIFEGSTGSLGGHDRSGGGLGLALCRFMVDQHRGSLWAENRATGAVFSFVLPLHRSEETLAIGGANAN